MANNFAIFSVSPAFRRVFPCISAHAHQAIRAHNAREHDKAARQARNARDTTLDSADDAKRRTTRDLQILVSGIFEAL